MPESDITLADILSLPEEGSEGSEKVKQDVKRFKERVSDELNKVHWVASLPKVVEKVGEMLNIPLPKVMIDAWKKGDEIRKVLQESAKSPDDEFSVELAEHTLDTEFKPQIEIRVGEMSPVVLDFLIRLSLELKGIELMIRKGEIYQVRTGTCQAGGQLLFGDLLIAERELEPIRLPGVVRLSD